MDEDLRNPLHPGASSKKFGDASGDDALAGYAPVLHRGLSGFTNFAVCFTEVACLVSTVLIYGIGLANGGPSVVLWGFVLTSFMIMTVAYSLAEICAAYPAAGAVYNWAGQVQHYSMIVSQLIPMWIGSVQNKYAYFLLGLK